MGDYALMLVPLVLVNILMGVLWGAMALAKERREAKRFRAHMDEFMLLRIVMQSEITHLRSLLKRQEERRLRSRAREAEMTLEAQDEADARARIAVSRILDGSLTGEEAMADEPIEATTATLTNRGRVPTE